jgi:tetratricopeptide (TPR) repeat protein
MRANRLILAAAAVCLAVASFLGARPQESPVGAAKRAYEKGEYSKAIGILQTAAAKEPANGEIQLLLTKCYLQTEQVDAAVSSAEKAVSIDPKNSVYHDWLGQAYGEKASRSSMFRAYPLARKTQKEFETAAQLDERNFEAMQNLIEYDCTAPSVVGGGEDKARPLIQKLISMDAAQGHYAEGNCRTQKKDFAAADAEFAQSLAANPKSLNLIYEMAVYFTNRGQGDHVLEAAEAMESVAPSDPRVILFRAIGWILKGEKSAEAQKSLREYLRLGPAGPNYPAAYSAHYWLGRLYENQKDTAAARNEYQMALKLNGKYKNAQEALKRLGSQ